MIARVEDHPTARDPAGTNPRLPLSVAIITLNEETNLKHCLASVRGLASEVVVIDSGSIDGTREVAEQAGAICKVHAWPGHVAQKNFALEHCTQPWVLCLDADEAVSDELAATLRRLFASGDLPENGFFVNRLNFYLGKWIHHAWYPEWRLRLVRRGHGQWGGLNPHDKLTVKGATRRLKGDLLHHPFSSVRDHFETELKYARITAESLRRSGQPFRWHRAVFSPWLVFLKTLLLKGGWRDGWRGWIIASAKWFGTFAKYAFLLESRWSPPAQDAPPT
jgi:glycosyltransferase involved in cell wall biosynthesis